MADTLLAVGFARDDGPYFLLFEEGAKRIRVITFVGQKLPDARDQADAFLRHDTAAVLPGVGINTHGRRNSSTIAWILLLRPPLVSPIA